MWLIDTRVLVPACAEDDRAITVSTRYITKIVTARGLES